MNDTFVISLFISIYFQILFIHILERNFRYIQIEENIK